MGGKGHTQPAVPDWPTIIVKQHTDHQVSAKRYLLGR